MSKITLAPEIFKNLRTILGEFNIPVKSFAGVIQPIANLLQNLESGKWIVMDASDQDAQPGELPIPPAAITPALNLDTSIDNRNKPC